MFRTLCSLALLSTAACGSGRLVPSDPAEPEAAPPSSGPVAAPAPTYEPTPGAPTGPAETSPNGAQPSGAPAGDSAAAYNVYGGTALPIRRIGQWSTSGITTPAREIIRDDSSYARFWSSLGAGARPSVDFSRDVVIAAAAGQRTTGGHAIAVERVTREGAGLAVQVVETVPGDACAEIQQVTQPVDVVVVAAADAQTWSFSDVRRVRECR